MLVEGKVIQINLDYVLHLPSLRAKVILFSISVVADHGCYSLFGPNKVAITNKENEVITQGTKIGRPWWLDCDVSSHELWLPVRSLAALPAAAVGSWHLGVGHLSVGDIGRLKEMSTVILHPISVHNL